MKFVCWRGGVLTCQRASGGADQACQARQASGSGGERHGHWGLSRLRRAGSLLDLEARLDGANGSVVSRNYFQNSLLLLFHCGDHDRQIVGYNEAWRKDRLLDR